MHEIFCVFCYVKHSHHDMLFSETFSPCFIIGKMHEIFYVFCYVKHSHHDMPFSKTFSPCFIKGKMYRVTHNA